MADEFLNLWANLCLSEREDDEVKIQAVEVTKIVRRGQYCIVGKLMGERIVSKETIKDTLKRWWRISGTFTFKILGENVFLIEFEQAKDKRRVLDGRPWVFEGNLFLVEDFDGRTAPTAHRIHFQQSFLLGEDDKLAISLYGKRSWIQTWSLGWDS